MHMYGKINIHAYVCIQTCINTCIFILYTHTPHKFYPITLNYREKWSALGSVKFTEHSLPKGQGVSIMHYYDLNTYIHVPYYKRIPQILF